MNNWFEIHRRAVRVAAGGILLFYSKQFPCSLLFLQAFRVTGWPVMRAGWKDLVAAYRKAKAVMYEQLPEMRKWRELVPRLEAKRIDAIEDLNFARKYSRMVAADAGIVGRDLARAAVLVNRLEKLSDMGDIA